MRRRSIRNRPARGGFSFYISLLTKIKVVREKKQEKVKPKATGAAAKILKVNRKK